MNKDYDNVFPYPEYREHQPETLKAVVDKVNDGVKVVIIRAPVGSGKSVEAVTLCELSDSSYYVTPQIMLQKQLSKEFPNLLSEIKGRANYTCLESGGVVSCSDGRCTMDSDFECEHECPYITARNTARQSKSVLMNFAYFITVPRNVFGIGEDGMMPRETLIIDECHGIPNLLLNHIELKIPLDITSANISTINEIKKLVKFDDIDRLIPHLVDFSVYFGTQINELGTQIKVMSSSQKNKPANRRIIKKFNKMVDIKGRIAKLLKEYEQSKEDPSNAFGWVVSYDYDKRILIFQPIYVSKYTPQLLWSKADTIVLMSGTIYNPKMFLKDIGLSKKEYHVVDVPSTFPVENRPIYLDYVGKMNYKNKEKMRPKMVNKVQQICSEDKYKDEKVIIHCHSYENAEYFAEYLRLGGRPMILQDRSDRIGSLDAWQKTKNGVFLSVNMTEGLDLVDDACRCQIMIKVPFPNLSDKRIKGRMNIEGDLFYHIMTLEAIGQAVGRAVRSKDDWADFYILDASFGYLYNRYKKMLPKDFVECVKVKNSKYDEVEKKTVDFIEDCSIECNEDIIVEDDDEEIVVEDNGKEIVVGDDDVIFEDDDEEIIIED